MAEYQPKTICWSCGNSPEACICGAEKPQSITVSPPKEILPSCGLSAPEDGPESIYYRNELMARPCCVCGDKWECTITDWVNATCPHCGASGSDGQCVDIEDAPKLPSIKATMFSKKYFSTESKENNEDKENKGVLTEEIISKTTPKAVKLHLNFD